MTEQFLKTNKPEWSMNVQMKEWMIKEKYFYKNIHLTSEKKIKHGITEHTQNFGQYITHRYRLLQLALIYTTFCTYIKYTGIRTKNWMSFFLNTDIYAAIMP